MKNKKIIYIIGDSRSGTTLLENVLAKSHEIISVGELRNLSDHIQRSGQGIAWNWNCSCGKPLSECVFWDKILNNLKVNNIDVNQTTKIVEGNIDQEIETINFIGKIYESIFDEFTNINFIVDSSKIPYQGYRIYKALDYDVKVIYLKRDIRAVSLSKKKWILKKHNITYSVYRKMISTLMVRLACNKFYKRIENEDKILIHYEYLSKQTNRVITDIRDKFDIEYFDTPEYMYLKDDHTIGGSPNRFKKRKIKYDSNWEKEIKYKPLFRMIGKILSYL